MHEADILRCYRAVFNEEAATTQHNQYLNGHLKRRLVPGRLNILFNILKRLIEEDRHRPPTKVINLYLDPTDPKDLPLIEEKYLKIKAKYCKKKKTATRDFLEDIQKAKKAESDKKKKARKEESSLPSEWMLEFIRRSREQLNQK